MTARPMLLGFLLRCRPSESLFDTLIRFRPHAAAPLAAPVLRRPRHQQHRLVRGRPARRHRYVGAESHLRAGAAPLEVVLGVRKLQDRVACLDYQRLNVAVGPRPLSGWRRMESFL